MPEINLLSEEEIKKLVMCLANGSSPKYFTEPQAKALVDWAEKVRLDSNLLDLILKGALVTFFDRIEDTNVENMKFKPAEALQ
jgi:hypothetical protein